MLKILIGAIASLLIYSIAYGGNFRSYTEETTPVSTDIFLMQQADDSANNWITFGNMVSNYLDALYQSYDANMILWPSAIDATEISYLDNADTNLIAAIDLNTAKVTNTDNQDASEVATNTINFDNNLSGTDTTVQAALETIDELTTGGTVTWPTVAGIPYWTSGTAWGGAYTLTSDIDSGSVATEIADAEAIFDALELKADSSSVSFNMSGSLSNLLFDTGDNFLNDSEDDTDHAWSASKIMENRSKDIVVEDPADTDEWIIFKATSAMTISDIHCIATGGTSVVIDVNQCDSAGASCASVDAEITCDTDGAEDDGTFTDGTVDAGDWIQLEINTVTGTVTSLSIGIFY